nr:MAG TPA: hypothetical protein [Caudoviricetes sp.]
MGYAFSIIHFFYFFKFLKIAYPLDFMKKI